MSFDEAAAIWIQAQSGGELDAAAEAAELWLLRRFPRHVAEAEVICDVLIAGSFDSRSDELDRMALHNLRGFLALSSAAAS
jgi:hypothetical protein